MIRHLEDTHVLFIDLVIWDVDLLCIGAIGVSEALLALHDARHGGEVLSASTSVV